MTSLWDHVTGSLGSTVLAKVSSGKVEEVAALTAPISRLLFN
jgi:hypothetical protein